MAKLEFRWILRNGFLVLKKIIVIENADLELKPFSPFFLQKQLLYLDIHFVGYMVMIGDWTTRNSLSNTCRIVPTWAKNRTIDHTHRFPVTEVSDCSKPPLFICSNSRRELIVSSVHLQCNPQIKAKGGPESTNYSLRSCLPYELAVGQQCTFLGHSYMRTHIDMVAIDPTWH